MTLGRRAGAIALLSWLACSCGYRPLVADRAPSARFCIVPAPSDAADAAASAALEAGARQVLARAGALSECGQSRRVELALVSIQATPDGVVAVDGNPLGRGMRVVAIAMARLEHGEPVQAQGEATLATTAAAWSESQAQADARAMASRRAGERLARRLLGEPSAGP